MSHMRDYAAEAEQILRAGEQRILDAQATHAQRIAEAVSRGEAVTVFGVRYAPADSE